MRLFYIVAVAMARGDELRGLYIWFWDNYENSFFYRIRLKIGLLRGHFPCLRDQKMQFVNVYQKHMYKPPN